MRNLAVEATDSAVKHVKDIQKVQKEHADKLKAQNQEKMDKIMKEFFVMKVKAGETGKLYGSITNADIASELSKYLGEKVDKKTIKLASPLKELGMTEVEIKLPGGVKGKLKVKLERK